jgi:hypothetical protein
VMHESGSDEGFFHFYNRSKGHFKLLLEDFLRIWIMPISIRNHEL